MRNGSRLLALSILVLIPFPGTLTQAQAEISQPPEILGNREEDLQKPSESTMLPLLESLSATEALSALTDKIQSSILDEEFQDGSGLAPCYSSTYKQWEVTYCVGSCFQWDLSAREHIRFDPLGGNNVLSIGIGYCGQYMGPVDLYFLIKDCIQGSSCAPVAFCYESSPGPCEDRGPRTRLLENDNFVETCLFFVAWESQPEVIPGEFAEQMYHCHDHD